MLNSYSKTKNELNNVLTDLNNVAASNRSKEMVQLIQDKLEANIFSLVVVGQFKRGKTTLINTLLGQDLLPTSIIPLTSIITILKYGEKLNAIALMNDGSKKEIPIEDIQLYVTEKHNPKNKKDVSRVEISYPSVYLKSGVQIIDTPGVASTYDHNTKTTYQYLPQSDAAIFLVSVDPPLTQAELIFLQDLKKNVSRVFFIQNKIDMVNDSDRQESLAFTKKVIEEQAGFNDVIIYPLSAKDALKGKIKNDHMKVVKSGLLNFEQALEKFLLEEKGRVLLNSSAEKIKGIIGEEMLLAELEEKSLRIPLQELEDKLNSFKFFLSDINQECIDSGRLLTEEVKALCNGVLVEDLEKLKQEKTKFLIAKIDEFISTNKGKSNKEFIELINWFMATQIRNIFSAWREQEEKILKEQLKKTISRFVRRMNNIFEKIFTSSSELFGITKREIRIQETLPTEIEFRFQTEDEEDILSMTFDVVKKILPKSIAHKLILKEVKERAEMLIDRHCGKLRYDFSQRMEKLVRDYRVVFGDTVKLMQEDVLRALETGLLAKKKTTDEISNQEINLRGRIDKFSALERSIQNLFL
jgi:small GTP-binding protein